MMSHLMDRPLRCFYTFAVVGALLGSLSKAGDAQTQANSSRQALRSNYQTYQVPPRVGLTEEPRSHRRVPNRNGYQQPTPARRDGNARIRQANYEQGQSRQPGSQRSASQPSQVRRTNYQNGYLPQHLRTASNQPPIVGRNQSIRSTVANRLTGMTQDEIYYEGEVGAPVEEFIDGGCGSCDDCQVGVPCDVGPACVGGFCDRTNTDVCGCGDIYNCPMCQECWLNGFGGLICNTEFFTGAHAFDLIENGQVRGLRTGQFGFHGGVNIGLTLKRLTCGLVSGQVGASIYQSEYGGDGGGLFNETREQVFLTAGVFRRVDSGLQFGTVADILFEDWFYQTEMVQMRSEVSYVYGDGSLLGFRFTIGVQDGGLGHPFGIQPDILDTYRFFWRMPAFQGLGFAEVFGGFTEEQHGLIGSQADINFSRLLALQSGMSYVWEDETTDDSWNIYMRVVLRPQPRNWYRNYHRPFMPVADNGSMMTIWR